MSFNNENDALPPEHPALANYSPAAEKGKYTIGKILKWAAIGAAIGGVGFAVGSAALTLGAGFLGVTTLAGLAVAALGAITIGTGPIGWAAIGLMGAAGVAGLSALGIGVGTVASIFGGVFLSAAMPGLLIGAGIGAAIGLISGMSGAQDAADDKKADLISHHERLEHRQERVHALAMRAEQQRLALAKQAQEMGLNPTAGLPPQSRGAGMEL
jgi:hypothetical protein